ncbi:MAG: hypothetical protein LBC68_08355 [Prevotellaceae bacterium]|nr:hypothetical protein [Prevotellaceae bacterium]
MPFTYTEDGHILISIDFTDTTLNFVFDTGSTASYINLSHKPSKLKMSDSCMNVYRGGKKSTSEAQISEPINIKFNKNLTLKNTEFVVYNTYESMAFPIIGMNVIGKLFWHFDFANQIVTISEDPLPVPSKSQILNYNSINDNFVYCNLKINNNIFLAHFDMGCAISHIEYDSDSTAHSIVDTNMVILYLTKDYENVEMFAGKLEQKIIQYYNNRYFINFDSLYINDILLKNKAIAMYVSSNLQEVFNKRLLLSINFFKQFEQMYIDTKNKIIYLKPYTL